MDQLGLQGLLRSHNKHCFGGSRCETTEEVVGLVALREHVGLHEGVGAEAHLVLGDGEHEQGAIAAIEAENTTLSVGLLDGSHHSLLVDLGIQLHDSLSVLCRVGTGDFNSTSNSTCIRGKFRISIVIYFLKIRCFFVDNLPMKALSKGCNFFSPGAAE